MNQPNTVLKALQCKNSHRASWSTRTRPTHFATQLDMYKKNNKHPWYRLRSKPTTFATTLQRFWTFRTRSWKVNTLLPHMSTGVLTNLNQQSYRHAGLTELPLRYNNPPHNSIISRAPNFRAAWHIHTPKDTHTPTSSPHHIVYQSPLIDHMLLLYMTSSYTLS